MNQTKRIQKIAVKRIDDPDADISYLGTYTSKPEGDFTIDRLHTLDCVCNNPQAVKPAQEKLARIQRYLFDQRAQLTNASEDIEKFAALDAALDLIDKASDLTYECTCKESRGLDRNEYRYFRPGSVEPFDSNAIWIPADVTDKRAHWLKTMRENARKDYARMEAYNREEWGFIGIQARAEIVLDGVCQTITSGGLWGIESDSEESHFQEVEHEELTSLRGILHTMGFSKRAIATACKGTK